LAGTKQSPALSASSQTVKGIASFRKLVSGQAIPPYNDKRLVIVIAIAKAITPARHCEARSNPPALSASTYKLWGLLRPRRCFGAGCSSSQ